MSVSAFYERMEAHRAHRAREERQRVMTGILTQKESEELRRERLQELLLSKVYYFASAQNKLQMREEFLNQKLTRWLR